MKHVKSLSKQAGPARASILSWPAAIKAVFGAYANTLWFNNGSIDWEDAWRW